MRAAIFIDGGYLLKQLQDAKVSPDYAHLAEYLLAPLRRATALDLMRCYFYYCPPWVSERPTDLERRRLVAHERFVAEIHDLDRWQVRLGKLERRREGDKETYAQKRVDVQLSVDLVHHTAAGHVQHAILVAGDSDFIPAIVAAKSAGATLTLWCDRDKSVHKDLLVHADEVHYIDWATFPSRRARGEAPVAADGAAPAAGGDGKGRSRRRGRRGGRRRRGEEPLVAGQAPPEGTEPYEPAVVVHRPETAAAAGKVADAAAGREGLGAAGESEAPETPPAEAPEAAAAGEPARAKRGRRGARPSVAKAAPKTSAKDAHGSEESAEGLSEPPATKPATRGAGGRGRRGAKNTPGVSTSGAEAAAKVDRPTARAPRGPSRARQGSDSAGDPTMTKHAAPRADESSRRAPRDQSLAPRESEPSAATPRAQAHAPRASESAPTAPRAQARAPRASESSPAAPRAQARAPRASESSPAAPRAQARAPRASESSPAAPRAQTRAPHDRVTSRGAGKPGDAQRSGEPHQGGARPPSRSPRGQDAASPTNVSPGDDPGKLHETDSGDGVNTNDGGKRRRRRGGRGRRRGKGGGATATPPPGSDKT